MEMDGYRVWTEWVGPNGLSEHSTYSMHRHQVAASSGRHSRCHSTTSIVIFILTCSNPSMQVSMFNLRLPMHLQLFDLLFPHALVPLKVYVHVPSMLVELGKKTP